MKAHPDQTPSRRATGKRSLLLLTSAASLVAGAHAAVIQATFTDLTDTTLGEDLWQASYLVGGATFQLDQGFTIYFDYARFRQLAAVAPVPGDWDVLVLQPDLGLPDDGVFDALALVNGASLAQPFLLSFVWLGPGSPGNQTFETYDLANGFAVTGGGATAVVPEPAALAGLAAAGLGLWGVCRRSRPTREAGTPPANS